MNKRPIIFVVCFLLVLLFCGKKEKSAGNQAIPATDFILESLDGEEIALSALKGKVVVLDFWATWCGPCRKEIPHLVNLYNKYKERGLIILGIGLDDKDQLVQFHNENNISYPILIGTKEVARNFEVQAIPRTLFIDKKGKIRHIQVGFSSELADSFEVLIDSLLKE